MLSNNRSAHSHKVNASNQIEVDLVASAGLITTLTDKSQLTRLIGNTNHTATGTDTYITADTGGRMYITNDTGLPLNGFTDGGAQQHLRCEEGRLRVDTVIKFNVVTLKDDVSISGAYQFNSSDTDLKMSQRISLEVRSETGATNWTCEIGFSMDGTNWIDTISNINAAGVDKILHTFELVAPFWRFVVINL